jgi:hypothetical protein
MERRSNSRINLYLSTVVQVPSYNKRIVPARLVDISLGGAFIETEVLLPANAALIIEFKLPGKFVLKKFRLNSRIVHRSLRGVGVAFVGIPVGTANAMAKALSRYEEELEPINPDAVAGLVINNKLLLTS